MKANRRTALATLTAVAGSALLAACGKESSSGTNASPAAAPAKSEPVSVEAIQAQGQGFVVGSPMSVRTVYVFFDTQCPHCRSLWFAAKPLKSQAKFVWMPVRLLAETSELQGATILAAKDPVAAMEEHEAALVGKNSGITATSGIDAQRAMVKKNTELFNKYSFASVPTIVAKHAQSGALVVKEGALPTAELAAFLGLQPPTATAAATQ